MTTRALIIVDVQNDFITGSLPVPNGAEVAKSIAAMISEDGYAPYAQVVTTQDWHKDPGDHWSIRPDFKDSWPVHCDAGSFGAALHDDIKDIEVDARFQKGQFEAAYSGFQGTNATTPDSHLGLEAYLRMHDVTDVDVVGLALDYCVKATALDAQKLGFTTRVLNHYTAPVTPEGGARAYKELVEAGVAIMGDPEGVAEAIASLK